MASPDFRAAGSRSNSRNRGSRSSLPMYSAHQGGLSDEYINIAPISEKQNTVAESARAHASTKSPMHYLPPPFPPPSWEDAKPPQSIFRRHSTLFGWLAYLIFIIGVGALLVTQTLRYKETDLWTQEETAEMTQKMLMHHLWLWLSVSWAGTIFFNLIANLFPYVFRLVAGFVNPGQRKYWRIFFFMRMAITYLGASVCCYISYCILVYNNEELLVNLKKEKPPAFEEFAEIEKLLVKFLKKATKRAITNPWPKQVNDLLTTAMLWAIIFFFEKIFMLYISIHYKYRSDGKRIEKTKAMRKSLVTLYNASITQYPAPHPDFQTEDHIIAAKTKNDFKIRSTKNMTKLVDRALEDNTSSAALARRVWLSLVPQGRNVLTVDDIVEVIKSHRRAEAEECFRSIDENQNGDITLNELVLSVIELGRSRRSIFQGMSDINHAINTLDWICCIVIAGVLGIYVLMRYVVALKGLKDAMGISLLGLSFGFGRTLYEFLNGCIFIFFKHAYDIGDRIEVYNIAATMKTSVVVERISILYTVFRRIDNGKELQMSNDRLNMKRVENITRSGANREEISVYVDFNTTFTDIENLKAELHDFLRARENTRDYQTHCEIRLNSIFEMNKLELVCSFYHKSNWANEELRAARSSKFKCALLTAIRRLPISKPGSMPAPPTQRDEFEMSKEERAYNDFTSVPVVADATTQERIQGQISTGVELNAWLGENTTGLRKRNDPFESGGVRF